MAVAVVAGIAAVGGAAVSAVVAGTALTFGAAAAAFAIGAGLSVVSRALAPKPKLNTGASLAGLTATVREPATSKKIVYGRSRIGGTVVYITTSGADNKYLHMVIAMAGHEIDAFESVYFNDEKVWQGTYQSGWGSYARIKFYKGDQTTADSDLVSESAAWTNDHILRDTAYLYVRLEYDPDQFPNGIPNVSAIVRGKKIYDPRQDSTSSHYDASVGVDTHRVNDSSTWTWSQNPALAVRDYLVDSKYGLGEDAALINSSALVTAADYCDIDLDSNADPIPQLQINGIVDTANSRKENIDSMLSAMGGMLVYSGGSYFIRAAQYVSPTITIDESVMVGQIQVQTRQSRRSQYNGVKGIFLSKEKNYTVADYPAQISSTYATEDGDPIYLDMPLPFVTDNEQAQRLAKVALLKSRQQTVITVPVNLAGLKFKAGDVIQITNDRMGYDQKPFEVVDYAIAIEPSGGIRVDLRCIETASSIYNWLSDDAEDFLSGGEVTLYDGKTTQPPTSLTATEGSRIDSDGTLIPTIDVSWTAASDAFVDHYEVEWKKQADSVYKTINTVGTEYEIPVPQVGFTFDVRVRAVNALGVRSSYASTTVVLGGDTTAPGVPTSPTVSADNHFIHIAWTNPSDSDFLHVEIKSAATNVEGSASVIATVDAEAYVDGPFSVGTTRYYWLRSLDRSGNASAWVSAGGDTTVVLETVDLTTEVHNSVLAQEILNVELEGETILNLETGLEVDIQNLGDVAIFVNESNTTLRGELNDLEGSVQNLQGLLSDVTAGVADVYLQDSAPVAGVGGIPDPIPDGSRWYDTDDNNAPYYWNGTAWVSLLDPRIGQNASSITALQARMTTAEGDIDTNTADISTNASAITANASAISTLDTTVTNQGNSITAISADITDLETALEDEGGNFSTTSNAITVLQSRVTQTETDITSNATDITTLQSSLASAQTDITTNATAITALDTRVTSNETSITSQASDITSLQSDLTTAQSDITTNATALTALTTRVTSTESSISVNTSDISTLSSDLTTAQADIVTNAGAITTAQTDISANATAISGLDTRVTTVEGQVTSEAQSTTILTTRLDFLTKVEDEADADPLELETTGELDLETLDDLTAGTSTAIQSLDSRTTVAEGELTTQASAITDLKSTVNDPTTGVAANASGLSSLTTRVTSNENSITSIASDVTSLQADLTTAEGDITTNASAISSLGARVTTAEGSISSNASDITTLESSLTTAESNIAANASGLSSLTTRVTTAEGEITSIAADVTTLQADLTTAEGDITTNAGAISSLGARVTTAEGNITSNASDITTLQSSLTTAETNITANASAISGLDTRVTSAEGLITSIASDVSTLQADLTTAEGDISANGTAISSLSTRVTTAEGNITSNASDITALESSLTTTNSNVSTNASAISGLDTRVTTAEGNITSNASDITTLQSTVNDPTTGVAANATAISSLGTRVTTAEGNITTNASDISTLESSLTTTNTNVTGNATAISGLDTRVTAAESSITSQASDITSLQSSLTTTNSNVTTNATAISGLDTRVTSAEGSITSISSDVTTLQAGLSTAQSNITTNATAVSSLDTRVTSAEGSITSIASDVTSLTTTVGNNTASITTNATSINGIEANYTVKIDANNRISGFGLLSTVADATPFSEFAVIADKFSVVDPASTSSTPIVPFQISGGKALFTSDVEINGDLVVSGTINANRLAIDGVTLDTSGSNLIIANGGVGTTQVGTRAITNTARADMASNTNYSTSFISLASLTGQTFSNGDIAEISWGLRAHPEASGAPYIAIRVLVYQGTTLKATQYFIGDAFYDTTNWAQIQQALFSSTMQYSITADDSDWRFILQAATNTNGTFPRTFRAPGTYIQAVRLKR